MTGFSADWLSLREPADIRARDANLGARFVQRVRARSPPGLIDLACGTGANLRYLAPHIGGRQRWMLVDDDAALLARVGAAPECDVETRQLDLATQLHALDFAPGSAVTASALLDLVSDRWLAELVERCHASRCTALFVLSYDGRMAITPADTDDEWIRELVNLHQRGDKGFGPALGPHAGARACAMFRARGYEVLTARSDWNLLPEERLLQRSLLEGWAAAAAELVPHELARCQQWLARRLAHVESGRSRITVGHEDVLALPAS